MSTFVLRWLVLATSAAFCFFGHAIASEGEATSVTELYQDVPRPEGIGMTMTELEGAVFTDPNGKTLYTWPQHLLRNGYSGEAKGRIECYDIVRRESAGLMSPYPPGVLLPELETRPSCTDLWQPLLAEEGSKPIGDWTILTGQDGRKQWAYYEQALYTSRLDTELGDTIGGTARRYGGEGAAARRPAAPPVNAPPGFGVSVRALGGLLVTKDGRSVYAMLSDQGTGACQNQCLSDWQPLLAPALSSGKGPWTIVEKDAGLRQWAFRGDPLYTYALDTGEDALVGADVKGWKNVYLWRTPTPPAEFTLIDTLAGQVLGDAQGRTLYIYSCGDDSIDQLSCEHPSDLQVYRLAVCGAGDPERCAQSWRYVPVAEGSESTSRAWRTAWINTRTGAFAQPGDPGAERVWTYRDRPIYTYFLDERPGDIHGDATGEWRGARNGLKAFWVRNAYFDGQ